MNGGYAIVDCTGFDFSDIKKIDGIYAKMLAAYNTKKFVLCANMVIGSDKLSPIPAWLSLTGSGDNVYIVLAFGNLAYHITKDDNISTP